LDEVPVSSIAGISDCSFSVNDQEMSPRRLAAGFMAGRNARRDYRLRVLFGSPEIFPLTKTGGLAYVSAALPAALDGLGAEVRLVMPGYREALDRARSKRPPVPLGDILGLGEVGLIAALTPDTGLPLWLVDCPALYCREGGPYLDAEGRDWPDNAMRFAVFSHAVARIALGAAGIDWTPHVVHVNDWHLGLVPALLAARSAPRPASVLTLHNLAFQGVFPPEIFPHLGLPDGWFTADDIEFYGQVSFVKAGIRFADRLTTVSPRYACEILTPEFGCGLDGLLRTRANDLVGILNGIDDRRWTPEDPDQVPYPYNAHDLSGKRRCKAALRCELGLGADGDTPLIAYVSRLTEQKMADLLPVIGPAIAKEGAQLAVCGEGDRGIEEALAGLGARYPRSVAVRIGYREKLARRLLAGADILAAPARFEPCGLIQMYAMRFGTLPVVREVGGLADTVVGCRVAERGPTGFVFRKPTARDFAGAIERACRLYRDPAQWKAMQARAMQQDFGWRRSAERYAALYAGLIRDELGEDRGGPARAAPCRRRWATGLANERAERRIDVESRFCSLKVGTSGMARIEGGIP
jgi:starch synthase